MEIIDEKLKKCDICKEVGNLLCFECNSYYCESCFKFVHEKPANRGHNKENIDLFVPIDTKCKIHPNHPLDLFCIDEKGIKYINLILL